MVKEFTNADNIVASITFRDGSTEADRDIPQELFPCNGTMVSYWADNGELVIVPIDLVDSVNLRIAQ